MSSKPKATPRVGEQALLELELPLTSGLSPSRPLSAWFHGPEGMVLLQEPSGFAGFMAGTLGTLSMEEVFAHVLTGIRSGLLAVQAGGGQPCVVELALVRQGGGLGRGAGGEQGRNKSSQEREPHGEPPLADECECTNSKRKVDRRSARIL